MLGVQNTVVEDVRLEARCDGCSTVETVIVSVRPGRKKAARCGLCEKRSPRYDRGSGRPRTWRAPDWGPVKVFIEAEPVRVTCREHGVVVAHVPWARHGSGFTLVFEQQIAWLATAMSKRAVTELMRIAWRSVGEIIARVWAETGDAADRLEGVTRIGIDEISYKRGHKYLMVVVDHGTGNLLWSAPGKDRATLREFFDLLGPERCALITHVSADQAQYIAQVVAEKCPNAVQCADPFHIVAWATKALDKVRIRAWKKARADAAKDGPRKRGRQRADNPIHPGRAIAKGVAGSRLSLLKNPENLTIGQQQKLAMVQATQPEMFRAYQLKEGLRVIFSLTVEQAREAIDNWISWARRCRIPEFVALQKSILTHRESILAAIEHGLSNGRIESVNTKIRLMTRIAYGFKNPNALIALAMLSLGGSKPQLPGRKSTHTCVT